jgi:hypothetical protein
MPIDAEGSIDSVGVGEAVEMPIDAEGSIDSVGVGEAVEMPIDAEGSIDSVGVGEGEAVEMQRIASRYEIIGRKKKKRFPNFQKI